MGGWGAILLVLAYVLLVGAVSRAAETTARGRRLASSRGAFALGLTVYCTTWTYYGSVGKAATEGLSFLPVYLGPTLALLFGARAYRGMIQRAHALGVTSIADFVAARYGRSEAVAGLATLILVVGLIPYVGLQLGALSQTFELVSGAQGGDAFALGVGIVLAFFAARYGMRSLNAHQRRPGLIAGVGIESVIKLSAFVASALFVSQAAFESPEAFVRRLDQAAGALPNLVRESPASVASWLTVGVLSASAFAFLPRQFHVGVIQCPSPAHLQTARWLTPAYLLAINLLVVPLALGGMDLLGPETSLDTLVLSAPLHLGAPMLALAVFLGGLSAAAGMITVETTAMATMVTHHLVIPVVHRVRRARFQTRHLLAIRWAVGALLVLGGFGFHALVGTSYMMVAIGLLSFAATFILAPVLVLGSLSARPTRGGALLGLGAGFATWAYTLLVPALVKSGWLPASLLTEGPAGLAWLRPEALLGWDGLPALTHGVVWTTLATLVGLWTGSLLRPACATELEATAFFLDPDRYRLDRVAQGRMLTRQEAETRVKAVLVDLFEPEAVDATVDRIFRRAGLAGREWVGPEAVLELHRTLERELAGALGTAMAHGILTTSWRELDVVDLRSLAAAYTEKLVELRLSPQELAERVDYAAERRRLLEEQYAALIQRIDERDRQIEERERAEAALAAARDELEIRVAERTEELAQRNAELRLILDNARQGFVTVGPEGQMSRGRSMILDRWLALAEGERPSLVDAVAPLDPDTAEWLAWGLALLADPLVSPELAATQLPSELRLGARVLALEYHPVVGHGDRLLVVLSDVTAERARVEAEAQQGELLDLVERAVSDPASTRAFLAEMDALFDEASLSADSGPAPFARALHTLKGNAQMHGLGALADGLHRLETDFSARGELDHGALEAVVRRWRDTRGRVSRVLGASVSGLDPEEVRALVEGIERGVATAELRRLARRLARAPIGPRLERLGAEARRLALALGRPAPAIELEGADLRLESDGARGVLSALIHAVRNAVDHGLEPPEERKAAGKPPAGRIRLAAGENAGGWWVEVEDDGRGIDVKRLRGRALAPGASTDDIFDRLFEDGLTSRDVVSRTSGRGVGLSALRTEVERLGGRCAVESTPGRGTRMRFSIPG